MTKDVWEQEGVCAHLSFFHGHGLTARCAFFVYARQEVLRDAEGVLQQGVIWMTGGCVFQKILFKTRKYKMMYIKTDTFYEELLNKTVIYKTCHKEVVAMKMLYGC